MVITLSASRVPEVEQDPDALQTCEQFAGIDAEARREARDLTNAYLSATSFDAAKGDAMDAAVG